MKKPGGLKALVLGMGPASPEPDEDDKPEDMGDGDDVGLTAAGEDLIAAVKAGDAAAVGRALKDAASICRGGYSSDEGSSSEGV